MGDLRGLIVFDLDGTLVDSRRDLADAANELIAELGGTPLSEEAVGRMVGDGARVLVRRALRTSGLAAHADDERLPQSVARFLAIYDNRLLRHTRPYSGIEQVLTAARGQARLAVLTNKPVRPTEAVLAGLGLRSYFDDVVGGDGEWPRKPDPGGLRYLMARAGATRARTLLVGDSVVDYETAARAGVRCCLATYGFGYLTFPEGRLTASVALARDPADLLPILEDFIREG